MFQGLPNIFETSEYETPTPKDLLRVCEYLMRNALNIYWGVHFFFSNKSCKGKSNTYFVPNIPFRLDLRV